MLARTADNLFWLARYVERAEFTARIIDITSRLAALPKAYGGSGSDWESALSSVGSLDRFKESYETADEASVLRFLVFDAENPSSIRSCIESARANARAVRTALTSDMWQTINAGWLELRAIEQTGGPGADMTRARIDPFLDTVKTMSREFDGMAYRNMLRNDAYYFN
ncbi:MAG TPA: alpha-E domain-containing protein, partial [Beijerinckiaceae bacterium]